MKACLLLSSVLCATFVLVFTSHCAHKDPSGCNMTCNNAGEIVGCEHETCTCVLDPANAVVEGSTCGDVADCSALNCDKHGESAHCLDRKCKCLHGGH